MSDANSVQEERVVITQDTLLEALNSASFYMELIWIGGSIALAYVLAMLVKNRAGAYLKGHPPRRIDPIFIMRPLELLFPLLALLYLGIAKPIVMNQGGDGIWIDAVMQLGLAFLFARAVTLFVHARFISYLVALVIMGTAVLDVLGLNAVVTGYLEDISFGVSKIRISALDLLNGVFILIVVFWLATMCTRTLESYLTRKAHLSYASRELTLKFVKIFLYFIAILITLSSVGVDLTAFAVFGGALGVGIGLGLQQITANFFSGISLLMEKSIRYGDIVEIDGNFGTVKQINIRYTRIEAPDGREIIIPNEQVISNTVVSYTGSTNKVRVDVNVGVAYGSDVRLVQQILLEAARENPKCIDEPEPGCWLREFADSSLNFLLVFWVADMREGRYGPQSEVMTAILDKFEQHGIEIPFPHQVNVDYKPPGKKTKHDAVSPENT